MLSSRPAGVGPPDRQHVGYSFKDDKIKALFKMLNKAKKLKLPEPKNPEDVDKTNDPHYCLYHRGLEHRTKLCWALKDKLQALVDAGALKLKIEQKTTTTNMTSCMLFGEPPLVLMTVIPIPIVVMRTINSDPHHQQEKGFIPILTADDRIMWVHLDLFDDNDQWTTVTRKKSKGKSRQYNVIIASTLQPNSDVNTLTDSKKEEVVMAASTNGPLAAVTR